MKKQTKKIKTGIYWHCHHDILCESVWDYDGRVKTIKRYKPDNEIKVRLKLFKEIKGKLPKELDKTWKEYDKKSKEYNKVRDKFDEVFDKYNEVMNKYIKTDKKYVTAKRKYAEADEKLNKLLGEYDKSFTKYREALNKYKPQLEKLHAKECGCKEWRNGEIRFTRD